MDICEHLEVVISMLAFASSFLSYLLVYIIFGVCIVVSVLLGIAMRKRKNAKESAVTEISGDTE